MNKQKKIIIVTPYFFPKTGGLENYAFNIATSINLRDEYEVCVISTNHESKTYQQDKVSGMTVHRLPILFKISNTPFNPLWFYWFRKIYRDENPDVIIAHTPVPIVADIAERVRGKIPFVLTYHNDLVKKGFVANLLAIIFYYLVGKKTLENSDRIIATSDYYIQQSNFLKDLKKKIDTVSPSVNFKKFNKEVDKTWLKKKYKKDFTVLFVGQMDKSHDHKGINLLIRAVSKLKKSGFIIQLLISGKGSGVEKYKNDAIRNGFDDKIFVGHVSDKDLPKYYAGADVLVLPSTTSAEGFGMVLLEANACATAVIGSDIGGISQAIINEETGLLIKPNNVVSLEKSIIRLYMNPALTQRLGEQGATWVESKYENTFFSIRQC